MRGTRTPWTNTAALRGSGVRSSVASVLVAGAVAACGFPRPPDVPGDASTQFTVVATDPAAHAASVDPNVLVRVTFSSSLGGSVPHLAVSTPAGEVAGSVSIDGPDLTFHPAALLASGSSVTVTVASASDAAGNALPAPVQFDFTTKTTLCVKPGGVDGCYARASDAIAAARSGDSIAVLEGDYMDNITVDKSIALLGGFAGAFTIRDPSTHTSTIRPAATGMPIISFASGSSALDGLTLADGNNPADHGGAIRVDGGTVRIENCVIARNNAFFAGGGIYIDGGASVVLVGNQITDNTVGGQDNCSGAGILVESATATLRDNTIQRNRILQNMGSGAGVLLVDSVATFINNHIENNHAADQGQAGSGGGITSVRSQVTISGGTISHNDVGNTTGTGAGLDLSGGSVRLDGVTITGNATGALAGGGAGAIHAAGTKLIVSSSIIASNIGNAGAIVADPKGSTAIVNCTIADNTARGILASSTLTLVNSVLLRDGVGLELSQTPQTIIQQNALFGNTTNAVGTTLPASNLTVDPRIDGTLHLMADSPLIDAGIPGPISTPDTSAPPVDPPTTDIDGDPRVIMGKTALLPDIGADEYRPRP